ncbi:MAG: lipid-A-disaccharide synthase N-terminal domain-containing protein [Phycisphaeraceae bacterium]|nr:lipid-A-disaccharide synthase N-terminal domain-containing protein [Phycisphaeraceae bacterium]
MFFMRFFVQWIHSERQGRSAVPVAFWWFSLAGGVMLFTYACARRDPVFMLGQGMGLLIYTRNLMLIRREKNGKAQPAP